MVVLTKRAHLTLKLIWFTEKRNPRRPSVRGRFRDPEKRTVVWGSRILDFDKIPAAVWRTRLPRTRAARALPCTERYNTNTRCGSNGPLPAPRKPFFLARPAQQAHRSSAVPALRDDGRPRLTASARGCRASPPRG